MKIDYKGKAIISEKLDATLCTATEVEQRFFDNDRVTIDLIKNTDLAVVVNNTKVVIIDYKSEEVVYTDSLVMYSQAGSPRIVQDVSGKTFGIAYSGYETRWLDAKRVMETFKIDSK